MNQSQLIIAETDRLKLRYFSGGDRDALKSILSDREVMEFSIRGVHDEKQIREFIDRQLFAYLDPGFGLYAIIHKQDNRLVGYCGLIKQIINNKQEIEIGYRLARQYWGRGLATEAVKKVKEYGKERFRFQRLICIVEPENTRSIRVAEKIGMKLESQAIYQELNVNIYSNYRF